MWLVDFTWRRSWRLGLAWVLRILQVWGYLECVHRLEINVRDFSGLFSLFSIRKVLAPAGPGRKHPERCVEQHLSQSIAYTLSVESDWFSQHSIRRQFHDRTAQPKLTSREGIYFLISVPKSEIKFLFRRWDHGSFYFKQSTSPRSLFACRNLEFKWKLSNS